MLPWRITIKSQATPDQIFKRLRDITMDSYDSWLRIPCAEYEDPPEPVFLGKLEQHSQTFCLSTFDDRSKNDPMVYCGTIEYRDGWSRINVLVKPFRYSVAVPCGFTILVIALMAIDGFTKDLRTYLSMIVVFWCFSVIHAWLNGRNARKLIERHIFDGVYSN